MGLKSGLPNEVEYALHHLVKISHERGDKYKFEAFPTLANGLIDVVLGVSSLYYNIEWEVSFTDEDSTETHVLNGMSGTRDILQRIQSLQPLGNIDDLETKEFSKKLELINQAGLVIRNMVLLEENASFLSQEYSIRDFLCIALNLPKRATLVELKHYALEIAEQLTPYWSLDAEDPLYTSLLNELDGSDRGAILTALRAISRISMNLEENNRLKGVPISRVKLMCDRILLPDEEFKHACLDFLYQFTAMVDNVGLMLEHMPMDGLIDHLSRLLLHGAKKTETKTILKAAIKGKSATEIPNIPLDLLEQILKCDEPERSTHWLRACFEEDSDSDITQIALWQAYQSRFSEYNTPQHGLLPAAEFIKNVSNTFPGANAQVINGPNPKFIIKGIRPRHLPMDPKGRIYARCLWRPPGAEKNCGEFILEPQNMWEHLVGDHFGVARLPTGRWNLAESEKPIYNCHWNGCRKYEAEGGSNSPYKVGMHVKVHLPHKDPKVRARRALATRGIGPNDDQPAEYLVQVWYDTPVDERGEAAGIPLTAALILRNIARNVPKLGAEAGGTKEPEGTWMMRLFLGKKPWLFHVFAHNRSLGVVLTDLVNAIGDGGG